MAVTPARWIADKSVLARLHIDEVADVMIPRLQAGEVGIALVTELEVGFSTRSTSDYRTTRGEIIDRLIPVAMPVRAEQRAREIQAEFVARGQHRAASVPDLLLAAIADVERMTVLHYDSDFDLIAQVTGQEVEWVVAPGTVD